MRRLTFVLLTVAGVAAACTSALVGAGRSASGHALLWKHRDSGFPQNFIERVDATDSTFAYVGLFNGGDSLLREVWTGVNERGFAIMNTASYNLAPDTAKFKDREGIIMTLALRRCTSAGDFALLLDSLPRPLGVQANFGVIDATGAGAYFEANDYGYTTFPLERDSLLIRTNFSCSGTCGDGLGRMRYANAVSLLGGRGLISPRLLTDTISRSFYHAGLGCDVRASGLGEVEDKGEFIPRRSTSASVVIQTAPQPEMWVILGYPPLSTAQKVTLDSIPCGLRPTLPGALSPVSAENLRRRDRLFRRAGKKWFVNLRNLEK